MNPRDLFLTISSALGWSFFDLARKKIPSHLGIFETLGFFTLLQTPFFLIWALSFDATYFTSSYLWIGGFGLFVNLAANLLFITSVRLAPLSQSVPMLSFVPVFTIFFSYLLLGERLNLIQLSGIGVIVFGAFVLNGLPSFKEEDKKGPFLMLVAALFWALMGVLDKLAIQRASIPMHAFFQNTGISLSCFAISFYLRKKTGTVVSDERPRGPLERRLDRRDFFWFGLGTFAAISAISFQLLAIQKMYVGLFEASKRAANMGFALLLGRIFFGEKLNYRKFLGVLLMSAGIFVIFLY